jgi:hypothetical protein
MAPECHLMLHEVERETPQESTKILISNKGRVHRPGGEPGHQTMLRIVVRRLGTLILEHPIHMQSMGVGLQLGTPLPGRQIHMLQTVGEHQPGALTLEPRTLIVQLRVVVGESQLQPRMAGRRRSRRV